MAILTSIATYFMAFVNLIALTMASVFHATNLTIAWLFFILIALLLFVAVVFVSYFIIELFLLFYHRLRLYLIYKKLERLKKITDGMDKVTKGKED